jgi:hypothetical protein
MSLAARVARLEEQAGMGELFDGPYSRKTTLLRDLFCGGSPAFEGSRRCRVAIGLHAAVAVLLVWGESPDLTVSRAEHVAHAREALGLSSRDGVDIDDLRERAVDIAVRLILTEREVELVRYALTPYGGR